VDNYIQRALISARAPAAATLAERRGVARPRQRTAPFDPAGFQLDAARGDGAASRVWDTRAIGLAAATRYLSMAREQERLRGAGAGFLRLDLPLALFDGIFANASLFHVPVAGCRAPGQLHATLKPGGVLFCLNPHGHDEEGWNLDAGAYLRWETWRARIGRVRELQHYYRPPGLPRESSRGSRACGAR
jgi:SAM-dependent methyltransferase